MKPVYFVVYKPSSPTAHDSLPIADYSKVSMEVLGTLPHLMDRDFIPALQSIWFCLHLPASCFDFLNTSANHLKMSQTLDIPHEIRLLPSDIFAAAAPLLDEIMRPALVIADDEVLEDIKECCKLLAWKVDVLSFSSVHLGLLPGLWTSIANLMEMDGAEFKMAIPSCERLDTASLLIPFYRLLRQFQPTSYTQHATNTEELDRLLFQCLHWHTVLATLSEMENSGHTDHIAEEEYQVFYRKNAQGLKLPLTVSLPGLPSSYCRDKYSEHTPSDLFQGWDSVSEQDTFQGLREPLSDAKAERAAIELVTTHRACASGGLGLCLPVIPAEIYGKVTQLEDHFRRSIPKPAYVWKTLDQIGMGLAKHLTPLQHTCFARATQITAFTNFPVGWTILPEDTSPIMCRVPIAYRPLLPLTRTIQHELYSRPMYSLKDCMRILLLEGISKSDHLHSSSIRNLQFIEKNFQGRGPAQIRLREAGTPAMLRHEIEDFSPDILILSAHGSYDKRHGIAGIVIGDTFCIGPELGPMPPLVLLSACNVAPRGAGAISVAELLIREGALAVLGTQIPVHVERNATLMVRFLVYLIESALGNEPHMTVAEAWRRTASLNAVNDIVQASRDITEWAALPASDGVSPLQKFMQFQSPGQLRPGHVYRDSERLLLEIGKSEGINEKVRRKIEGRNYIPETLFYFLLGCPDRIRLNNSLITVTENA